MSSLSIKRVPERCLWGALLFCTVYQSYRYPLQLNFSGTSPTYSDTPAAFQLMKFIGILFFCAIAIRYIPRRVLPFKGWVFTTLTVCMCAYPAYKAIISFGSDASLYLVAAFWPLAALILVLATTPITTTALDRYFRFVFFYAIVSNAIEIFLFLTIGRLPALAYENSFSVRFGGFLDDPNGFAALLYMLMGWAYHHFSGRKRFLAEFALVLCVLLTQSLTAIAFLALLTIWFLAMHFIRRPRPLLVFSLTVVFIAALISIWTPLSAMLSVIGEEKSGSVNDHISQVATTRTGASIDWILGSPVYAQYESWWTSAMVNYGVPWGLLCLGLVATLIFVVYRTLRKAHGVSQKAVLSGMMMLACYFFVANINLPFYMIFPVNFLFFTLLLLVFFEKIQNTALSNTETEVTKIQVHHFLPESL